MTPITSTARVTTAAPTATNDADKFLRDVAFILKLTRRVKEEMTADRSPSQITTATTDRALVA